MLPINVHEDVGERDPRFRFGFDECEQRNRATPLSLIVTILGVVIVFFSRWLQPILGIVFVVFFIGGGNDDDSPKPMLVVVGAMASLTGAVMFDVVLGLVRSVRLVRECLTGLQRD